MNHRLHCTSTVGRGRGRAWLRAMVGAALVVAFWGPVARAQNPQAACPSFTTVSRFSFSADGSEVTDKRTNLTWARCYVGQAWDGSTCTGGPTAMTHETALSTAQAATGGWRLPDIKELSSIMDRNCGVPAIDQVAFPHSLLPGYHVWSSTPFAGGSAYAWTIGLNDGVLDIYARGYGFFVRLVRPPSP